jgi:predicted Zn-dependent peptidase
MKKIVLYLSAMALTLATQAQMLDRSKKPQPGPAPEIKLGNTQSFTLPNGLRVFVVENHKLPTISCSIQLDVKPALEGNKAGYRDMMSELLLTGTKNRSKDKLNAEIDLIGARINATDLGMNGSGLKKYTDKILDLMSDIAMNAVITQEELDKAKKQTLSGMETEKNEPDAMLRNVTAVINFGNDHPYGEVPNDESVKNISLDVCQNYYKTYFRPNVAYMAVVGDVTLEEIKPLIEKYFGGWQKAEVPVAQYPGLKAPANTHVYFVPRQAAVQSVINVTAPIDLKPGTEDLIKARVANTVLGGGSQGRLFLDLREKHAWTYGSYSSIKEDDLIGSFTAYAKCRNAVSDSSVAAIMDEIRRLQTEKVAPQDVANTISYMSGNFAIALEDPARIAQFAINIERYHIPKDFYSNYLKNLSAVTADDIMMVARKYMNPDKANIIVVGSKKDVAEKLKKFSADGKIDMLDNYGRPLKEDEKMAAPSNITAADVMKKYVNALGGEKAISAVKDIKTVSSSMIQNIPLTITEMKKAPGKYKEIVEGNMNGQKMALQKQVYNGTKGYQEQQGQKADMSADDLEEIKVQADIYIDLHPEKYGITRKITGMEKVNGNDAYIIEVSLPKGKTMTEYYDAATGFLVKKIQTQESPRGPVTQTSEYADYKEVPGTGGYKIPYTVKEGSGAQVLTATVQSVEINKGIDDAEFE